MQCPDVWWGAFFVWTICLGLVYIALYSHILIFVLHPPQFWNSILYAGCIWNSEILLILTFSYLTETESRHDTAWRLSCINSMWDFTVEFWSDPVHHPRGWKSSCYCFEKTFKLIIINLKRGIQIFFECEISVWSSTSLHSCFKFTLRLRRCDLN